MLCGFFFGFFFLFNFILFLFIKRRTFCNIVILVAHIVQTNGKNLRTEDILVRYVKTIKKGKTSFLYFEWSVVL